MRLLDRCDYGIRSKAKLEKTQYIAHSEVCMRLAGRRAGATIFSSVASAHGNPGGFAWTSHDQLALWTSCELAFGIRDSENLIGNHVSVCEVELLESEILPSVSQQRRSSSTTGSASVAGGFAWTSHDHIEVRVLSELGFGIREPG